MTQEQQQPRITIDDLKKMVCERLTKVFSNEVMQKRLLGMAGGDDSRVAKNFSAFLSMIMQDDGGSKDNKRYLAECTIASLSACFLESMNMQLPFDSRQLVSMVIYQKGKVYEAELDISYKGFINALSKHYDNAYVDAKLVFEDDEFTCEETAGKVSFVHKAKNPFRHITRDFIGIVGGYCFFSYTTKDGSPISRIVRMSKDDIVKIKSKAKTKMVWDDFPSEMAIKALIRRGAKIPFAAIDMDVDVEEVNNRHYQLEKPNSEERIKLLRSAQQSVVNGEFPDENKPVTVTDTPPPQEDTPVPTPAPEPSPADPQEIVGENNYVPPPEDGYSPPTPKTITDADFEEDISDGDKLSPVAPVEWDGRTLFIPNKGDTPNKVEKDFADAASAAVYLKKTMQNRTLKSTRLKYIDANPLLIGALIVQNNSKMIQELHDCASQGDADPDGGQA